MELFSGSEMVVRSLKEESVEYIFGYPGGSVLNLYDAIFLDGGIRHILVRHEQAATHAADGYARATGRPGVVLVTSGPGATNAITGIATAYMDSIPMVVISGQVTSDKIGEDAFQETDMIGVSRPIVKHSFLVSKAEDIPEIIKKAFYLATTGRCGPVVVDIPRDMTDPGKKFPFNYPADVSLRSYTPLDKGHSGQIKKATKLLLGAKRPVIYVGGGVIQGGAHEQLIDIAQRLNYPVTMTLMGLGAYPGTDRQCLGMLGMHGTFEANTAMHNADVIFAVGARFDDRVTNTPSKFCPNAKIIHIDVDPTSISKIIPSHFPIVGQARTVLIEMLSVINEELSDEGYRDNSDDLCSWWETIDGWRKSHGLSFSPESRDVIKPQDVIKVLHEVTSGDAYITTDVGQHQMFAAQYYRFDKPRRWITSGGLGTMGFGLPAAMGVQLAHKDADVVCVTGEGSIQMNIQELSTCAQYNIPVKIVNLNNGYLGMVKQWQDMLYDGRYSESSYEDSLPDFVKLVESYGHVGIRVDDPRELEAALRKALELKDKLVFLDVHVDPHEHVYPMLVAPGGSMRDMWLDKGHRT